MLKLLSQNKFVKFWEGHFFLTTFDSAIMFLLDHWFFQIVAMACINLASKIEEAPRRIRDVINVFHHLRQLRGKR